MTCRLDASDFNKLPVSHSDFGKYRQACVVSYGKILRRRSIVAECPFIIDIVSIVCMYVHL